MIEELIIDAELHKITKDPERDLYLHHNRHLIIEAYAEFVRTIDAIYDLLHPSYSTVVKPDIYVEERSDINAFACICNKIVIYTGLITEISNCVNKRYSVEQINKYNLLKGLNPDEIQKWILVYTWRFIVLHELYHIWHGHLEWISTYCYDGTGNLIRKNIPTHLIQEASVLADSDEADVETIENNIADQSIEMDADLSACCMIINMLVQNMSQQYSAEEVSNQLLYMKYHTTFLLCGMYTTFSVFDENSGAQFWKLSKLDHSDHPIPALRIIYIEDAINSMLFQWFKNVSSVSVIEEEWNKVAVDLEADNGTNEDWQNNFSFPAYSKAGMQHIGKLKRRFNEMYDSLKLLSKANMLSKFTDEDISSLEEFVYFTENGESLRGWS